MTATDKAATAHSPLPWTLAGGGGGGGAFVWIWDAEGHWIADFGDKESPTASADRAFTLRAVNCHDDLLAACKSAYEWARAHADNCEGLAKYEEGVIFDDTKGCTCYLSLLRAAYFKATGQQVAS